MLYFAISQSVGVIKTQFRKIGRGCGLLCYFFGCVLFIHALFPLTFQFTGIKFSILFFFYCPILQLNQDVTTTNCNFSKEGLGLTFEISKIGRSFYVTDFRYHISKLRSNYSIHKFFTDFNQSK